MLTRVVKVGGSLLDWSLLASALQTWLVQQPRAHNVLVAGGGALADAIRETDRHHSLDLETAHWLCIDAMSITARILQAILPDSTLVQCFTSLQTSLQADQPASVVFDCRDFLQNHESNLPGPPLPRDWSVTSDSIAARLAKAIRADELVLLKSTDPPPLPGDWAATGFVDSYFPTASVDLSVRAVNLRRTHD